MEELKPEDADGGFLSRSGRVMEMLSEHTLEGWLEGYLLNRAARILLELRGVCTHHRLNVQPACEVVGEVEAGAALARADLVAEPADHFAGVAAGPQRIHAPGPGIFWMW